MITRALYRKIWKRDLPESWVKEETYLVPITVFSDFAYRGYRETKIAIDVHVRAHGGSWTHVTPNSETMFGNVDGIVSLIKEVFGFDDLIVSSMITKADIKTAEQEAKKIAQETGVKSIKHVFPVAKIAEIANRIFSVT